MSIWRRGRFTVFGVEAPRDVALRRVALSAMMFLAQGSWFVTSALIYPHIEKPEGQAARLERIPRVRVTQIVMDHLAYGWSPDEMCRQHPYLRPAEVHAAMSYYFDHQDEIENEIRAEWEQSRREKDSVPRSRFFLRMRDQGLL
jgi:hypothetical protein